MSIWAEIKHTINSRVGKNDIMPLDVLISEQTRMVASDEEYASLEDMTITLGANETEYTTYEYPQKLKMINTGTIRFVGQVRRGENYYVYVNFEILKNNDVIYSWNADESSSSIRDDFSIDISFKPYDTISLKVSCQNTLGYSSYVDLTGLKIYGTIKPNIFSYV